MAVKGHNRDRFDTHFQEILDNIDIKVIAPRLVASGIISSDDKVKLEEKPKKSAVKFMRQKIKNHKNGNLLFKQCLTQTSQIQGHQELLSILYNPVDSNPGIAIATLECNLKWIARD